MAQLKEEIRRRGLNMHGCTEKQVRLPIRRIGVVLYDCHGQCPCDYRSWWLSSVVNGDWQLISDATPPLLWTCGSLRSIQCYGPASKGGSDPTPRAQAVAIHD